MTVPSEVRLRLGVAIVITMVWAVSFVADILIESYDPPASVGALMLLVSGALFGENVLRKVTDRRNGDSP